MTTEQLDTVDETAVLKARIHDLEAALNQNNVELAAAFRLTPALANLFGLLLSVPLVTPDIIQHRLEIATDSKVAIHRLRTILKAWAPKLGMSSTDVMIQGKRNVGYWIEPPLRERIKAFIANGHDPEPVTLAVAAQEVLQEAA